MRVSIIVAVAANGVIGRDNDLPWHMSADLRRFKCLTMGHHLVMGRRTFESLAGPLRRRTIIVLSSTLREVPDGVLLARSMDDALELAGDDEEVFVAGGAGVYREALTRADRLYLTRIHANIEGDTWFPKFDEADWRLVSVDEYQADEKNPYAYSFLVYDRNDESG